MKNQALFSSKDKSKTLNIKMSSAAIFVWQGLYKVIMIG